MKYINLNTKNQEEWQQGLNNYRFYLETIKSRFSKNFFQFYTQSGMHDSILIEFQVTKRQFARRTYGKRTNIFHYYLKMSRKSWQILI